MDVDEERTKPPDYLSGLSCSSGGSVFLNKDFGDGRPSKPWRFKELVVKGL